jgi:hypothetical protein
VTDAFHLNTSYDGLKRKGAAGPFSDLYIIALFSPPQPRSFFVFLPHTLHNESQVTMPPATKGVVQASISRPFGERRACKGCRAIKVCLFVDAVADSKET